MGPQDAMPPFRRFPFMEVPDTHRTIFRIYQPANYLQLVEQGSDSSHVGIFHSNDSRTGWLTKSFSQNPDTLNPPTLADQDNAPDMEPEAKKFVIHYAPFHNHGHSHSNSHN